MQQKVYQISIVRLQFAKKIKYHFKIPLNNQVSAQMILPPFLVP